MLREILFNATIPGAYINAVNASNERNRRARRHPNDDRMLDKSAGVRKSVWAALWVKLVSRFSRRAQADACQTPAE